MSVSAQEHHAFLARLAKTPPSSSADVDDGIRVLKTLLGECRHLYASPLDPLRIAKASTTGISRLQLAGAKQLLPSS